MLRAAKKGQGRLRVDRRIGHHWGRNGQTFKSWNLERKSCSVCEQVKDLLALPRARNLQPDRYERQTIDQLYWFYCSFVWIWSRLSRFDQIVSGAKLVRCLRFPRVWDFRFSIDAVRSCLIVGRPRGHNPVTRPVLAQSRL